MTIRAMSYSDGGVRTYDDFREAHAAPGTTWVRATAASPAELDAVADEFGLHPLAVEDVRNGVHPKVEEFDGYTFVLLKTAIRVRGETTFDEEIRDDPVGIFVGDGWLVTLATETIAPVQRTWEAIGGRDGRVRQRGADFAAYRVIDALVDSYFAVLDGIEDQIEAIEDEVVTATDRGTLERINDVRRELLSFRKLMWPSREVVGVLARGDPEHVEERTEKYFRDVYDHLVQLVDLTETYRELASGARDIYLNSLSVSTNEVMKRLTVIATILLPLTFVVGIYGMNFTVMPELGWTFGYPAVMLGMLAVSVILLGYFRQENWL